MPETRCSRTPLVTTRGSALIYRESALCHFTMPQTAEQTGGSLTSSPATPISKCAPRVGRMPEEANR